ncbi:hypothetical protein [Roseinatronobacter alkalisoli]|uniref:Uncharacterized protein n=1 Tax=Roseinatronobacter alkalisoli TaxID=3028235 RepID=A0ABT5TDH2_9RHOB|nr:hypothetical protein [Roseinatronobacter sp. HJB301]MDD7973024.1 hypothetical protein [Roseinatronobacter sp. HJB301]
MRHLLFAVVISALPTIAQAQMGGAVCRTGQGCTCFDISDAGLFPILLGESAAGAVSLSENLVIDRSANTTFRTSRDLGDIHRRYGGRDECPMDPGSEPLIPLDGTWLWRTLNEITTGCQTIWQAEPARTAPALTCHSALR